MNLDWIYARWWCPTKPRTLEDERERASVPTVEGHMGWSGFQVEAAETLSQSRSSHGFNGSLVHAGTSGAPTLVAPPSDKNLVLILIHRAG